ncbi:MAG: hypothetical protein Ctma_1147 [Catillopecten margaritatus gill symbiont]|uniref:Uncharacterized protein n=1 Tax=Catillopecten margaritatus gill symbiont TaxID=3083288 RepID=A0AAU6PHG9_9GAMM
MITINGMNKDELKTLLNETVDKINKIDTAHSNIFLQHIEAQNLINGLNTGDLQGKVNK